MCLLISWRIACLSGFNSSKLSLGIVNVYIFLTSLSLGNVLLFCRLWCCIGTSQRHNNDRIVSPVCLLLFPGLSHPRCKKQTLLWFLYRKKQRRSSPGSEAFQPAGFHPNKSCCFYRVGCWPGGASSLSYFSVFLEITFFNVSESDTLLSPAAFLTGSCGRTDGFIC